MPPERLNAPGRWNSILQTLETEPQHDGRFQIAEPTLHQGGAGNRVRSIPRAERRAKADPAGLACDGQWAARQVLRADSQWAKAVKRNRAGEADRGDGIDPVSKWAEHAARFVVQNAALFGRTRWSANSRRSWHHLDREQQRSRAAERRWRRAKGAAGVRRLNQ
jgi:hypothetical protein